jgi:diaminohydroxyphosphoribosylaminopyrimidine deaminase/5-amino-6-(5-phosphoribosylamino)uracil reductase
MQSNLSASSSFVSSDYSQGDREYMALAIRLAKKGLVSTDPNPRVGCVIVNEGQIVGSGFHVRSGEGHAEVNALKEAGDRAKGATAYVTLEPCSHYGRTPPCAEALIKAGLARVVSAMQDPNPQVSGRGLTMMSEAGIQTQSGLLEDQAKALNPGFIKRMTQGLPFVRVKLAMSLDGRTAMQSGESQWITGPAARADVQRLRARSSAIVTGIGSIELDDSKLTVRDEACADIDGRIRQPLRVVLDAKAKLSTKAAIVSQPGRTLWCTQEGTALEGVESIRATLNDHGRVDPLWLMRYLASEEQCNEVLIEAGASVSGAMIKAGVVDELVVYMAPTLMGSSARPLLDLPMSSMAEQQRLEMVDLRQIGDDLRLTYRVRGND